FHVGAIQQSIQVVRALRSITRLDGYRYLDQRGGRRQADIGPVDGTDETSESFAESTDWWWRTGWPVQTWNPDPHSIADFFLVPESQDIHGLVGRLVAIQGRIPRITERNQ